MSNGEVLREAYGLDPNNRYVKDFLEWMESEEIDLSVALKDVATEDLMHAWACEVLDRYNVFYIHMIRYQLEGKLLDR